MYPPKATALKIVIFSDNKSALLKLRSPGINRSNSFLWYEILQMIYQLHSVDTSLEIAWVKAHSLLNMSKTDTHPLVIHQSYNETLVKYMRFHAIFTSYGSKTRHNTSATFMYNGEENRFHLPSSASIFTAEAYIFFKLEN